MQEFGGGGNAASEDFLDNEWAAEGFHRERADAFRYESRQHFVGEATEVSIHDVDGHLDCVEVDAMLLRRVEHSQVNDGIFVSGEADEANLTSLFGGLHCVPCAFPENSIRRVELDDFMELHEIDVVRREAFERLIDLLGGRVAGAAVDFGHEENFVAIAVF